MGKAVLKSVACPACGGLFKPVRKGHLYCSETCRKRYHKRSKAKLSAANRAKRLATKLRKLANTSFGKYLIRELRRAGNLEVLRGHSKTSLNRLVKLRSRCNTVSGYSSGKPIGTYELSHIYASQGKHGLGRLHPINLVIAPRSFNRSIGVSVHSDWEDLYCDSINFLFSNGNRVTHDSYRNAETPGHLMAGSDPVETTGFLLEIVKGVETMVAVKLIDESTSRIFRFNTVFDSGDIAAFRQCMSGLAL